MLGWLSTSLWFFSLTINILISSSIQIESAKLNRSSIHLTVAGHSDSLLLIKNTALVAGSSS
jgi:hypothetical protein